MINQHRLSSSLCEPQSPADLLYGWLGWYTVCWGYCLTGFSDFWTVSWLFSSFSSLTSCCIQQVSSHRSNAANGTPCWSLLLLQGQRAWQLSHSRCWHRSWGSRSSPTSRRPSFLIGEEGWPTWPAGDSGSSPSSSQPCGYDSSSSLLHIFPNYSPFCPVLWGLLWLCLSTVQVQGRIGPLQGLGCGQAWRNLTRLAVEATYFLFSLTVHLQAPTGSPF